MSDLPDVPRGELLTDPEFWSRPFAERHQSYADLRRDNPVSWQPERPSEWLPEGGRGFWAITGYDDVVALSKDFKTFSNAEGTNPMDEPGRPVETLGMLHMDPPDHRRFRRIVNPAFTRDLSSVIERTATGVIDLLAQERELDVVGPIIHNYTIAVICDILGLPQADRGDFLAATMQAFGPDREAAIKGHNFMIDYVVALAQERRKNPQDDIFSQVATAEVDGHRLSDKDVGYFVALLLGAGAETSASTIMQGLWRLHHRRDQLATWRNDVAAVTPTATEELLRIGSAVICFRRTATRDVTLHGSEIKAGEKVVLFYESANNDERVFADPQTLDVLRPENQHVAFGGFGPHLCLGAPLARVEIATFFRLFFDRFADHEITAEPVFAPNQRFNIIRSMTVRLTPA